MYLNAKDCALEWITMAVEKADKLGKRTVVIGLQAHFWEYDIYGSVKKHLNSALDGIGEYYNRTNLGNMTLNLTGTAIQEPFEPLYTHLTKMAKAYPNIVIYTVNADSHVWTEVRANSDTNNNPAIVSNQNWMILQTEGDGRALTMYAQLKFRSTEFMSVQADQIWSKTAFDATPYGHSFYKYSG